MSELASREPAWTFVSVDDAFLRPEFELMSRLRRALVTDVLPVLGGVYSSDFAASLLQTAVVYLRDRITAAGRSKPVVVDSYYYKILAKCRLVGDGENPMFGWWRSFPQPQRVVYLDVAPETAWQRSRGGAKTNRLEYYGEHPERGSFETFQSHLRTRMFDEIRHLPVTEIHEGGSIAQIAQEIRQVLSNEC